MSIVDKIYNIAPVWFQNVMCSVKGWLICRRRYNDSFHRELNKYLNNAVCKEEALKQFLLLTQGLAGYDGIISTEEYRLLENDKLSVYEVLSKFPILEKSKLKSNVGDYINTNFKGETITMHTSGTTGSGLIFPYSVDMENKQWAVWWRYRINLGLRLDTWCGWFGGRAIINPESKKGPFWRINKPGKQVMFSLYHMTNKSIESYCKEIIDRNIYWLHGYPSSITRLSRLILENNLSSVDCVRVITTGAENLYKNQIQTIKRAFPNAIVRQHYGLAEGVANFSQDKDGHWHIDDDFCFVEFIPVSNDDLTICKIIGTGFSNAAFPLVRYFTGDLAKIKWNDGKPVIEKILGRSDDYITLPNGAWINSGLDYILKDSVNVKEAQLHQKTIYDYVFNIVKGSNYSCEDEQLIEKGFRERFGKDVSLSFNYVEEIEKTKAGKFKMFISDVK